MTHRSRPGRHGMRPPPARVKGRKQEPSENQDWVDARVGVELAAGETSPSSESPAGERSTNERSISHSARTWPCLKAQWKAHTARPSANSRAGSTTAYSSQSMRESAGAVGLGDREFDGPVERDPDNAGGLVDPGVALSRGGLTAPEFLEARFAALGRITPLLLGRHVGRR